MAGVYLIGTVGGAAGSTAEGGLQRQGGVGARRGLWIAGHCSRYVASFFLLFMLLLLVVVLILYSSVVNITYFSLMHMYFCL